MILFLRLKLRTENHVSTKKKLIFLLLVSNITRNIGDMFLVSCKLLRLLTLFKNLMAKDREQA